MKSELDESFEEGVQRFKDGYKHAGIRGQVDPSFRAGFDAAMKVEALREAGKLEEQEPTFDDLDVVETPAETKERLYREEMRLGRL